MKKTTYIVMALVLILSVMLMAAAPAPTKLARLKVWNRTGAEIKIRLRGEGSFYYVTAQPGRNIFTIERTTYKATYWACGGVHGGTIKATSQVKLTFPVCGGGHHHGETTMFKIRFK